jgi:hypothetical protein
MLAISDEELRNSDDDVDDVVNEDENVENAKPAAEEAVLPRISTRERKANMLVSSYLSRSKKNSIIYEDTNAEGV